MNPRNFLELIEQVGIGYRHTHHRTYPSDLMESVLRKRYRDEEMYRLFDDIYINSNEPEFSKASTNNNIEEEIIPGNEMIEFLSQFGVVK